MANYYELRNKYNRVVFRGTTPQLLSQFEITVNTLDYARREGSLWGVYSIESIPPTKDFVEFKKEDGKKEKKKQRVRVVNRTSSSVWYTYKEKKK